ncbi:MAG: Pycsar system effector family protein [Ginsengibacter sp.]
MRDTNKVFKKIEQYVRNLFEENVNPILVFHNLKHTETVVNRTKEIAGHYNLSENDMLTVFTAAWFHDTGHLFVEPVGHEAKSVEIMKGFMVDYITDQPIIDGIADCIMATRMPRNPGDQLQEIICDADTYHLGTKEFKDTNKLNLEELRLRHGEVDRRAFDEGTERMLTAHTFYTNYCRNLLDDMKEKNIKKLKKKLAENDTDKPEDKPTELQLKEIVNELPRMKEEKGLMTKGIQTMLRLTSDNHMQLSGMADSKANILISVNAIIISVILSVLLRRLQTDAYLTIPTVIFLIFTLCTIVISILSTRPKVSEGVFSEQEVIDKQTNLLFFGNFYKKSLPDYEKAMHSMMNDPDYLYGSLIKDIYFLGVVLGKKYRMIRLAYNVFMTGIIISVIAFAIAVLFFSSPAAGSTIQTTGSPF